MSNDLIQCPLCEGLARIPRTQLVRVLADPTLFSRLEKLLAQLTKAGELHPEPVPVAAGAADFQTNVHSWNPKNPMWNRSPKE